MKLRFLLVPLFSLTLASAQPPPAGGPGGPGMPMPAGPVSALRAYLGLSDTQIAAIGEAHKSLGESQRPAFEQMRTKQEALHALLATANPDPAAVGKLTLEIRALGAQTKAAHDGLRATLINLLSPDQKTKLQTLEAAAKLQHEIGEARALQLLSPPEGGPGMGGPGMAPMGPMGPMRPMNRSVRR